MFETFNYCESCGFSFDVCERANRDECAEIAAYKTTSIVAI